MAQVSYEFKSFNQAQKAALANVVITQMTGNDYFQTIQAEVNLLKTIYNSYSEAAAAAVNGGKDRVLTKNNRLEEMVSQLVVLGQYVDILSKGSEAIILSSGFPLRSQVRVPSTVTTPTGLLVENLNRNGIIEASWDTVPGAVNYPLETMVEGETWKNGQYPTTAKKNLLGPFPQDSKVFVRICTNGTGGKKSDWCEPQSAWVS